MIRENEPHHVTITKLEQHIAILQIACNKSLDESTKQAMQFAIELMKQHWQELHELDMILEDNKAKYANPNRNH